VRPPNNIASQDSNADVGKGSKNNNRESKDNNNSNASSPSDAFNNLAIYTFKDNLAILRNYYLISINKTVDIFKIYNFMQLAIRK
jgi:hypothetical protein